MRLIEIDSKEISKKYPYKAGVAIPFNWNTETGMPNNVELESLNEIEDYLAEVIDPDKDIMVGVITGNNVEEFLFYTSDPESFQVLYDQKIATYITSHTSQFFTKEDKDWDAYFAFKGK